MKDQELEEPGKGNTMLMFCRFGLLQILLIALILLSQVCGKTSQLLVQKADYQKGCFFKQGITCSID